MSGINRGYNLGYSAYLSGTVGAARQAAILGSPGDCRVTQLGGRAARLRRRRRRGARRRPPREAVRAAAEHVPERQRPAASGRRLQGLPDHDAGGSCRGGDESFAETKHPAGRTIYWNVFKEGATGPEGTDVWAVNNGYVSVTPMRLGETDPAQMESLKSIFK